MKNQKLQNYMARLPDSMNWKVFSIFKRPLLNCSFSSLRCIH